MCNIEYFDAKFCARASNIFLRPTEQYSWEKIITGAKVTNRGVICAVDTNTIRGFHRCNNQEPGALQAVKKYFTKNEKCIKNKLMKVEDQGALDCLSTKIQNDLGASLANIKPTQLKSYNNTRKIVDLCIEHLVAMANWPDEHRCRLVPLLYLPLDSWIFKNANIFTDSDLTKLNITRKTTFGGVTSQKQYSNIQQHLACCAEKISKKLENSKKLKSCEKPFRRIYFDMLWNCRICNEGGNLFQTNGKKLSRCNK